MFHAFERGWNTSDYLLAHIIDALRINNWQRTDGARKKPPRNTPEPFPRPGDADKKKSEANIGDSVTIGSSTATITTVGDFIARRAERERNWHAKKRKRGGGS